MNYLLILSESSGFSVVSGWSLNRLQSLFQLGMVKRKGLTNKHGKAVEVVR